jgi:mono/diheme cytochrome c family protein
MRPRGRQWLIAGLAAVLVIATWATLQWRERSKREVLAEAMTQGDVQRGEALIRHYGCAGCHTIEGVAGADGLVGPPLVQLRERVYLAGSLRNTPDELVRWIVRPRSISPQTAMPATGITDAEARDVAAYLYAH